MEGSVRGDAAPFKQFHGCPGADEREGCVVRDISHSRQEAVVGTSRRLLAKDPSRVGEGDGIVAVHIVLDPCFKTFVAHPPSNPAGLVAGASRAGQTNELNFNFLRLRAGAQRSAGNEGDGTPVCWGRNLGIGQRSRAREAYGSQLILACSRDEPAAEVTGTGGFVAGGESGRAEIRNG